MLESLFDLYFVRPERLAARKVEINKKLIEAGKQPRSARIFAPRSLQGSDGLYRIAAPIFAS